MRTKKNHLSTGSHAQTKEQVEMDHINPWSSSEWVNRGAQMLDKQPAVAQKIISKGIQLDPQEAISWFNLGIGLHQQGKINAAIRAY